MLREEISIGNFALLRNEALRQREKIVGQEEVLDDVRQLLEFADRNNIEDEVVELFF